MKEIQLFIAVPSTDMVHSVFMMSMLSMQQDLLTKPLPKDDRKIRGVQVLNKKGSILPQMREQLVEHAIENGATHLLFVDSDMEFPRDILHRWLCLDAPIVAANCVTRKMPMWPTARNRNPDDELASLPVYTTEVKAKKGQVEQVWRIGTGIMLIEMEALKGLPRPLFQMYWDERRKDYTGEDWAFCERLEAAGIPIIIDHQMSWGVRHTGTFGYDHPSLCGQKMVESYQRQQASAA